MNIPSEGDVEWWGSGSGGWATCMVVAVFIICYITPLLFNKFKSTPWEPNRSSSSSSPSPSLSQPSTLRFSKHITETDLQMLLNELEEKCSLDEHWNAVIEKKSDNVFYSAKCCDPKDGGPTKYISTTVFENCTTELLKDFYMDNDFRKEWDKTVVHHEQLELNRENGIEVGRTIKKFPFLTPREYVLAWRVWEGEEKSFYCLTKAVQLLHAPKQSKYKRVEVYLSGWRIRKVQGRDACEIKLLHQEDAGLKREMAKLAFSKGIWSYVCKMEANLRKYAKRDKSQCSKPPDAVTFMQKVPTGINEALVNYRNSNEESSNRSIVTNKEEVQEKLYSRSHSKEKLLAKGLLLLGGTVFLTVGHSSLGAKLAVACLVKKLVKKKGVSENILNKRLFLTSPQGNKQR